MPSKAVIILLYLSNSLNIISNDCPINNSLTFSSTTDFLFYRVWTVPEEVFYSLRVSPNSGSTSLPVTVKNKCSNISNTAFDNFYSFGNEQSISKDLPQAFLSTLSGLLLPLWRILKSWSYDNSTWSLAV